MQLCIIPNDVIVVLSRHSEYAHNQSAYCSGALRHMGSWEFAMDFSPVKEKEGKYEQRMKRSPENKISGK